MANENELHTELLSLYRRTGEATGYWPCYFLREVREKGGLTVARRLLREKLSTGFDKLVQARRADLSIEAIALSDRFRHLFTSAELEAARARLDSLPSSAFPTASGASPTVLTDALGTYSEGAVEHVAVNRYERSEAARAACVRAHGCLCGVCDLDFEARYGELGRGFIHVHHKRPISRLGPNYRLDPEKDLVPVCPNCHAMLHRREPPLDVEQLRLMLRV